MPKLNDTHLALLQDLVDQGVAKDLESALQFCVLKTWNEQRPDSDLDDEEKAILKDRFAALDRGEGIPFKDGTSLMQRVAEQAKARAAERVNA